MIQATNLSYHYPHAAAPAVRGISFSVAEGEIFGFLGPSGSGKSTTQKILLKMLAGYGGQAAIAGRELAQWDRSLYARVGVGFELPNHYLKLTALENLAFFRSFYSQGHDPMQLLEMVGLGADAHKPVADYSKGMKMRLNFVRALLHDPDILFLDEPTSGLDPVNARLLKDIILAQKAQGKTIFITTHQMHDADELCDRVAFLVDGEIKAMDSPARLKLMEPRRSVALQLQDGRRHTFALQGLGSNPDFLSLIREQEIATIHSEEPSLDDIFIKVTGKSLGQ